MKNPEMVDNNPRFREFLQYTSQSPEDARYDFIQAEGRRAGVQAGMLSLMTAGASRALTAGAPDKEGMIMKFCQEFLLSRLEETTSEALNATDVDAINREMEGGRDRQ